MRLNSLICLAFGLIMGCEPSEKLAAAEPCEGEGPDEWSCRDGADNNGDGDVDCNDEKCSDHPDCPGGTCVHGAGVEDSDREGADDTSPGSVPEVSFLVAIFPTHPSPEDDLECRVEEPPAGADTGIEATLPTFAVRWFVTSENSPERVFDHTTHALASEATGEGDEWTCEVTVSLKGVVRETVKSAAVTVLENHPPDAPVLEIQVQPNGNLFCVITEASVDIDSTEEEPSQIRYSYAWDLDGQVQLSQTGPVVTGADTVNTVGQIWTCLVTPTDGVSAGLPGTAEYQVPEGRCIQVTHFGHGYQFCST